jgi:ketopantoate hydroxymethyltransferase
MIMVSMTYASYATPDSAMVNALSLMKEAGACGVESEAVPAPVAKRPPRARK